MIKKFVIVLLASLTLLGFKSFNTVEASDDLISWESYNAFSSYYLLRGTAELSYGIKGLTFTIPQTNYHVIDAGGLEPQVLFYDSSDVEILDLDWYDTFGDQLHGTFDIDFDTFSIVTPAYMKILIPQSYSVTPGGYVDYIEANDELNQYYNIPEDRDFYFTRYESTTSKSIVLDNVAIPYNTYSIVLDVRSLYDYYLVFEGTYNSYIWFYDKNGGGLDIIYLKDYAFLDSDYIVIDIPYDTYDLNEATYFKLLLIVDDNDSDYLNFVNRNFKLDFNKDINVVYFMSQSTLLQTSVLLSYGGIPTEPTAPTPPTGFEFTGWFLENGDIYNFTHITSDMFTDNSLHIYAYFRVSGTASDYGTVDDTPDTGTNIFNVLSAFGFATDVGFIFIYLGLIVLVSVGLVVVKISGFIVLVVDIMITALFMYLGFLPLYVIALVFITLVVGILFYMGGVNSE